MPVQTITDLWNASSGRILTILMPNLTRWDFSMLFLYIVLLQCRSRKNNVQNFCRYLQITGVLFGRQLLIISEHILCWKNARSRWLAIGHVIGVQYKTMSNYVRWPMAKWITVGVCLSVCIHVYTCLCDPELEFSMLISESEARKSPNPSSVCVCVCVCVCACMHACMHVCACESWVWNCPCLFQISSYLNRECWQIVILWK